MYFSHFFVILDKMWNKKNEIFVLYLNVYQAYWRRPPRNPGGVSTFRHRCLISLFVSWRNKNNKLKMPIMDQDGTAMCVYENIYIYM